MNSLIPNFRRQLNYHLPFICQPNKKAFLTQPLQRPVVPAATPSQAISLEIKQHTGNHNNQVFDVRRRHPGVAGRLRYARSSDAQVRFGVEPNEKRRVTASGPRAKDLFPVAKSVIDERAGIHFVSDRAVECHRTGG
jgi:hypothetical protein